MGEVEKTGFPERSRCPTHRVLPCMLFFCHTIFLSASPLSFFCLCPYPLRGWLGRC